MREFSASRLSDGNMTFPPKIIIRSGTITVRVPGLFHNSEKIIPIDEISEVSIETHFIGYSDIIIYTTGLGVVHLHGFTKSDAEDIRDLINSGL
jgi:Bacterial PH domain